MKRVAVFILLKICETSGIICLWFLGQWMQFTFMLDDNFRSTFGLESMSDFIKSWDSVMDYFTYGVLGALLGLLTPFLIVGVMVGCGWVFIKWIKLNWELSERV